VTVRVAHQALVDEACQSDPPAAIMRLLGHPPGRDGIQDVFLERHQPVAQAFRATEFRPFGRVQASRCIGEVPVGGAHECHAERLEVLAEKVGRAVQFGQVYPEGAGERNRPERTLL
jgi:hypothetical protein